LLDVGHVEPILVHVGRMLASSRPIFGTCWAHLQHILRPSWLSLTHLGHMLGPSWPIWGPCWAHVWGMLAPCWGHVRRMLAPCCANLAEKAVFKKRQKLGILDKKWAPPLPQLKLYHRLLWHPQSHTQHLRCGRIFPSYQ
jgi:hypothetical protein